MTKVNVSVEAENFLATTNQYARLLPQQLAEQVPHAEEIDVHYEELLIGGYDLWCVTFVVKRRPYDDITIIITANQLLARHPQTRDPLWRGDAFLDSVVFPQIRANWGLKRDDPL